MHAFLRHLENVGFDGAPVVFGTDDVGREILSFIEGDVLAEGSHWRPGDPTPCPSWARTEDCLSATARLLRTFHDSAAQFVSPDGAVAGVLAATRSFLEERPVLLKEIFAHESVVTA